MAKRILVCSNAAFWKDTLVKGGYEAVGAAESGAQAVEQYAQLQPDLVLLDFSVPEMDGMQTLKRIKELDSQARVIVCVAMGQQQSVMQAMENGATDFIVKPVLGNRLLSAVGKCLK